LPPPTPHVGPTLAADTSNYTGAISRASLTQWRNAGYGLVLVEAIDPPPAYPPSVTGLQIDTAVACGLAVDAYIYCWWDMARLQRDIDTLRGRQLNRLWLDVEEFANGLPASVAARIAFVKQALNVLDAYPNKQQAQAGIYTGGWYWGNARTPNYMGNATDFANRLLWTSQYDGIPNVDVVSLYGGWQQAAIKQWQGTSTLAGVKNVDLNVVRSD